MQAIRKTLTIKRHQAQVKCDRNKLFMTLLLNNLHKDWYWNAVSSNPNITAADILQPNLKLTSEIAWNSNMTYQRHLGAKGSLSGVTIEDVLNNPTDWPVDDDPDWPNPNWYSVSSNEGITLDDIFKHDLPWNWNDVCRNPNLTMKDVFRIPKPDWYHISQNPNITLQDAKDYPELPWDYNGLSSKITCLSDLYGTVPWNWEIVFRYAKITINEVLEKKLPWNYARLSENLSLPVSDIIRVSYLDWDWKAISTRCTFQEYLSNTNLPWDFQELSWNKNIHIDDFLNHQHLDWNIEYISANPTLTLQIILDNPQISWHWRNVSRNPGIKIQDIIDNPDLPWSWTMLSYNRFDSTTIY